MKERKKQVPDEALKPDRGQSDKKGDNLGVQSGDANSLSQERAAGQPEESASDEDEGKSSFDRFMDITGNSGGTSI